MENLNEEHQAERLSDVIELPGECPVPRYYDHLPVEMRPIGAADPVPL